MTDAGFVIAAYGAVAAALAVYAGTLWRRTQRARAASLRIRRDAELAELAVPAHRSLNEEPSAGPRDDAS